jgi:sugar transferase (PEP-CTERM/EpsH1 system associated)
MKILMLAHRLPYPPDKGDRIRSNHELAYLAARHEVWSASFVDSLEDRRFLPALQMRCHRAEAIWLPPLKGRLKGLAGIVGGKTITEGYYRSRKMSQLLADWTDQGRFDAVLAFSSSMAQYALSVPTKRRVLDLCDLDSQKWLAYADQSRGLGRIVYQTEGQRLATLEARWLQHFDASVLITDHEAKPLQGNDGNVIVVGNGVNVVPEHRLAPLPSTPAVGFVGAMDYRPNIEGVTWFCREVWPLILQSVPSATFRIIGRKPARLVRSLDGINNVEVVGPVDDVQPYMDRLRVSVAPLQIARGLQNKVLEAMASARPVVLTPEAACGIPGTADEHFAIEEKPESFAKRVVRLLERDDEAVRLGKAGWHFVGEHFCWDREMQKLEDALIGSPSTVRGLCSLNLDAYNLESSLVPAASL